MIILDTDVLSEVLRAAPSESVLRWLAAQEPSSTFTTAITAAELLYGVEMLPEGRRRAGLHQAIDRILSIEFPGRILPFDEKAAEAFSKLASQRALMGRPPSSLDAMIAAIARSRNAAVATRNVSDFEDCGIRIVNPWLT